MCKVSDFLRFIIFADDTNIFCLENDPLVLVDKLNRELIKLTNWFRVNKLSLNVAKSNFMVFGKKSSVISGIKLNGITLEKVLTTKFLGVHIDNRFRWCTHIQTV